MKFAARIPAPHLALLPLALACSAPATKEEAPSAQPAAPAPAPPAAPTLPAELGFELQAPEHEVATAMREKLRRGKAVIPTAADARPWLHVMATYDDVRSLDRTLVSMGHARRRNPRAFIDAMTDLHGPAAFVGAGLLDLGDPHLARRAIEEILVPLLTTVDTDLKAAIGERLAGAASDAAHHPETRGLAAGSITDRPRMQRACAALFEDADPFVAWSAALPCAWPDNANGLIALTRHALTPLRARAVQALARAATAERATKFAQRYVLPMLDDPEAHVRGAALEALGYLGKHRGVADAVAAHVAEHLTSPEPTTFSHDWVKPGGGSWRKGNVPLVLDRATVAAQAQSAFNRMSDGAITTSLGAGAKPTEADRQAAAEQARAWLAEHAPPAAAD